MFILFPSIQTTCLWCSPTLFYMYINQAIMLHKHGKLVYEIVDCTYCTIKKCYCVEKYMVYVERFTYRALFSLMQNKESCQYMYMYSTNSNSFSCCCSAVPSSCYMYFQDRHGNKLSSSIFRTTLASLTCVPSFSCCCSAVPSSCYMYFQGRHGNKLSSSIFRTTLASLTCGHTVLLV